MSLYEFGSFLADNILVIFYDLLDEYTFTRVHVCTPAANPAEYLYCRRGKQKERGGCEQEVIGPGAATKHHSLTMNVHTQNTMNRGANECCTFCVSREKTRLWFRRNEERDGAAFHTGFGDEKSRPEAVFNLHKCPLISVKPCPRRAYA